MKTIRETTNELLYLLRFRTKSTPNISKQNDNYCDPGIQSEYYCDENGWFV